MAKAARRWPRLLRWAFFVAAGWFAVQGGEYSTLDLFAQRSTRRQLLARIDSLKAEVDSLEKYKKAVLTDPVLQERLAREEFGMVRGEKELLYRFTPPKSK